MIFRTQTEQAQGFAYFKRGQDADVLDAWPAQELVRLEDRIKPRDWIAIWTQAGGNLVNKRMVALKTDDIWTAISRFGTPYPPFDFNSGMGLEEIDREEAESLGLIEKNETLKPIDENFNDRLEASVQGLSPQLKDALSNLFGDQIDISGDTVKWRGK